VTIFIILFTVWTLGVIILGAYSDSPGIEVIRRQVAKFIEKRDSGIKSDWQNIILCAGASEGIRVKNICVF